MSCTQVPLAAVTDTLRARELAGMLAMRRYCEQCGLLRVFPHSCVRARARAPDGDFGAGFPRASAGIAGNARPTCLTQDQLRHGIKANDIVVDTTIHSLRNASTAWILSAWEWLKAHPETVLNGWRLAKFGDIDLAYDSLNNPAIQSTVHERFTDNETFALSVATVSQSQSQANNPDFEEDSDGPDYDDDYAIDPSVLCNIHGSFAELPANIIKSYDDLVSPATRS
ncbi:hypothetical protein BDV93DRAFT_554084 [Ceratobasidium sp. AG-I]|nr:hypothetical protein BDV93DRAFT_554084 [Ceratobasidium sp. AG-I]